MHSKTNAIQVVILILYAYAELYQSRHFDRSFWGFYTDPPGLKRNKMSGNGADPPNISFMK